MGRRGGGGGGGGILTLMFEWLRILKSKHLIIVVSSMPSIRHE